MNSKNDIIDRIIKQANDNADLIISEAKAKKLKIISDAKRKAKENRDIEFPSASDYEKSMLDNARVAINIDKNKIVLRKKMQIIDEIFSLSIDKLASAKNKNYKKQIKDIILNNAEDGDEVIICKNDKDIFDSKFIAAISKQMNIKLKLSKTFGDFKGGIILSNKICDKNLTLEAQIEAIRAEVEQEVASIVFG